MACESGATRGDEFTRVLTHSTSTSTFLLPPTLPFFFPSPSLPAQETKDARTTGYDNGYTTLVGLSFPLRRRR